MSTFPFDSVIRKKEEKKNKCCKQKNGIMATPNSTSFNTFLTEVNRKMHKNKRVSEEREICVEKKCTQFI